FMVGVVRVGRGPKSVGQSQVGFGMARAQARRGAILGHALADIPRLGERRSEAGVGVSIVRIVGLELDRLAVLLDGAGSVPGLQQRAGNQRPNLRVPRAERESPAILLLGVGEPPVGCESSLPCLSSASALGADSWARTCGCAITRAATTTRPAPSRNSLCLHAITPKDTPELRLLSFAFVTVACLSSFPVSSSQLHSSE